MEEKNNLDIDKKKALELYKTLAIQQDENVKLMNNLQSFTLQKNPKTKNQKQIAREEILRNAYKKLVEEQAFYLNENSKLVEELNSLESEMIAKDDILKKAHYTINIIPEGSDIEEDALKELNANLEEQQQLIQKLKTEIEHSKLPEKPSVSPSVSSPSKCIIV